MPHARYQSWEEAPNSDDTLYYGNWSGGNADGYILPTTEIGGGIIIPGSPPPPPSPPAPTFLGIHLQSGYTARVTTLISPTVEDFSIASGNLRQADTHLFPGLGGYGVTSLTVTDDFLWTGGTINDGDLAGNLYLAPGAEGVAEPTNAGTVKLGSTLTLQGGAELGSTLRILSGVYEVLRGNGFFVQDHSLFQIQTKPGTTGSITVKGGSGSTGDWKVSVAAGGTAEVTTIRTEGNTDVGEAILSPGANSTLGITRFENEGTTTIKNRTKLLLQADTGIQNANGTYKQEQLQANQQNGKLANTSLEAGSSIACEGKGKMLVMGAPWR